MDMGCPPAACEPLLASFWPAATLSLLNPSVAQGHDSQRANWGLRLFNRFTTVIRLRRIHRQPGASLYKESLIRLWDGAMTKEDHALWLQHDLAADSCCFSAQDRTRMENEVNHVFAENAPGGERIGFMAGRLALEKDRSILRVASKDNSAVAAKQPCDMFGQLRRVVHIIEGAPVMIISNLRTQAGLVNGSTGTVVGAVLRGDSENLDLREAVSATDVAYVVVDVPKYCGPVISQTIPLGYPFSHSRMSTSVSKGGSGCSCHWSSHGASPSTKVRASPSPRVPWWISPTTRAHVRSRMSVLLSWACRGRSTGRAKGSETFRISGSSAECCRTPSSSGAHTSRSAWTNCTTKP